MQETTENRIRGRAWDSLRPEPLAAGAPGQTLAGRIRSRLMRLAPRALVRMLAAPYIAGETRGEAVGLTRRLYRERGLHSTVDVLGEDITDPSEAGAMLEEYLAILEALRDTPHANISIKLSALGQALDEELCARHLATLLDRAATFGQFVRFDMEDHTTTDSTLRLYRRFVRRYPAIGVVLQARLHRTLEDIADLAPLRANVRLCLGIYRESPGIALQDKPSMKERLLAILEELWARRQYVGIATHDETVIRRALAMADRMGVRPGDFEIQMLLGVPRWPLQKEILGRGIKVRLYVPYGRHWYHYCLRRLDNNPEMARMVLGNLFHRGGR